MKNLFNLLIVLCITITAAGCNKDKKEAPLVAVLEIPEKVTVDSETMEISFRVIGGLAPEATDRLKFEGKEGIVDCSFTSVTDRYVHAVLPSDFVSGTYDIYVVRGGQKKHMGETVVFIDFSSSGDIELVEGNNIYGKVLCDGKPIEGAVISDGIEAVKTDADGVYQFRSDKENGYVFISIPSGYTVENLGVLPKFHTELTVGADTPEKINFNLTEEKDQENHTILFFGDMHLANRSNNKDRAQFAEFTSEINRFMLANGGRRIYAVTLGDMTWDLYWYSNNYCFKEYLNDINIVEGLPVWHVIGNHDHDMNAAGDSETVKKYKNDIAPTYYSFNIGKVHYVVLDDIECTNTGTGDADSRRYNDKITAEQLEWLEKDLSYIPKDTPVVLAMHAPLYTDSGFYSLNNAGALKNILSGYDNVHFFTGHTHKVYNVDKTESDNIFEHNAGAVCATWWWSAAHTPGIHIGQDGAPGGYTIMDVDGKKFQWIFKATGGPDSHQFRTYDRNSISITADKYIPDAYQSNKTRFNDYAEEWSSTSTSNEVYLNVWNYDPAWTIEVTENGKELSVQRVSSIADPLHLISYTAPAMNNSSKDVVPTFPTSKNKHMFVVKASSAESDIEIVVTDRFGNRYTETMKRPKEFNADIYKF